MGTSCRSRGCDRYLHLALCGTDAVQFRHARQLHPAAPGQRYRCRQRPGECLGGRATARAGCPTAPSPNYNTGTVTVSWSNVNGADSYELYESTDGTTFTQIPGRSIPTTAAPEPQDRVSRTAPITSRSSPAATACVGPRAPYPPRSLCCLAGRTHWSELHLQVPTPRAASHFRGQGPPPPPNWVFQSSGEPMCFLRVCRIAADEWLRQRHIYVLCGGLQCRGMQRQQRHGQQDGTVPRISPAHRIPAQIRSIRRIPSRLPGVRHPARCSITSSTAAPPITRAFQPTSPRHVPGAVITITSRDAIPPTVQPTADPTVARCL